MQFNLKHLHKFKALTSKVIFGNYKAGVHRNTQILYLFKNGATLINTIKGLLHQKNKLN